MASKFIGDHHGDGSNLTNVNADLFDGLNSTAYMKDNGWNSSPGQDANTQPEMMSDFSYSNNCPHTGNLIRFGASGYSLQMSSQYNGSGNNLSFRTYNNDSVKAWNPWYEIWHTGNLQTSESGGAGKVAKYSTSNGYLYAMNWIQGANGTGLFFPSGVHWHESGGTAMHCTHAISAAGDVTAYSDARLKSDVVTFPNALETVKALRGTAYIKDGKASIGVIAQEVEEVLPQVVHTADDEMGTKSVAYGNMMGVMIEAMKEMADKMDAMQAHINSLEEKLNGK